MNDFERAIQRMEKVIAACDELIAMAKKDISDLQKRKKRARILIEGFKVLPNAEQDEYRNLAKKTAIEIADGELKMVSCMGVGIRI
ncbi:MAG: hypothetical protein AB1553_00465 [Nitrospirota bacterium]